MTTKAEKAHLNALADLGCIVCRNMGYGFTTPEIHHIRTGVGMGQRNSHKNAIPLCHAHHRTGGHGVAYHAGRIAFEANYGREVDLLAQVNELLEIVYVNQVKAVA